MKLRSSQHPLSVGSAQGLQAAEDSFGLANRVPESDAAVVFASSGAEQSSSGSQLLAPRSAQNRGVVFSPTSAVAKAAEDASPPKEVRFRQSAAGHVERQPFIALSSAEDAASVTTLLRQRDAVRGVSALYAIWQSPRIQLIAALALVGAAFFYLGTTVAELSALSSVWLYAPFLPRKTAQAVNLCGTVRWRVDEEIELVRLELEKHAAFFSVGTVCTETVCAPWPLEDLFQQVPLTSVWLNAPDPDAASNLTLAARQAGDFRRFERATRSNASSGAEAPSSMTLYAFLHAMYRPLAAGVAAAASRAVLPTVSAPVAPLPAPVPLHWLSRPLFYDLGSDFSSDVSSDEAQAARLRRAEERGQLWLDAPSDFDVARETVAAVPFPLWILIERWRSLRTIPSKGCSDYDWAFDDSGKYLELVELLVAVTSAANSINATYFLDGYSLTGSLRHWDVVPWDDEITLRFYYPHTLRLLEMVRENAFPSLEGSLESAGRAKVWLRRSTTRETFRAWKYPSISITSFEGVVRGSGRGVSGGSPRASEVAVRYPRSNATAAVPNVFRRGAKSADEAAAYFFPGRGAGRGGAAARAVFRAVEMPRARFLAEDIFPLHLRPFGPLWLPAPHRPSRFTDTGPVYNPGAGADANTTLLLDQCRSASALRSKWLAREVSCLSLATFFPQVTKRYSREICAEHTVTPAMGGGAGEAAGGAGDDAGGRRLPPQIVFGRIDSHRPNMFASRFALRQYFMHAGTAAGLGDGLARCARVAADSSTRVVADDPAAWFVALRRQRPATVAELPPWWEVRQFSEWAAALEKSPMFAGPVALVWKCGEEFASAGGGDDGHPVLGAEGQTVRSGLIEVFSLGGSEVAVVELCGGDYSDFNKDIYFT